uniref:Uncharacterized protein n=1 Tax=Siphoviridae sp. ctLeh52 TaxID=2827849 RepID=A0A8S5RWQ7_9CAUD|nr:MAG TPA: hypothetical protein [Siphoviridae sp. ctLeh52]
MNMMNPMQMLRGMGSPRQFIQNMMGNSQIMSNDMVKNAYGMAQKGDFQGVEDLARNICKTQGINPDDVMRQIKSQFPF